MAFVGFLAGAALGGLADYGLGSWTTPYWYPYSYHAPFGYPSYYGYYAYPWYGYW